MGTRTTIAWTDATWSPVSGCTRVSEGCEHCYIARTPPLRMVGRKWDGDGIGSTTGVMLHPERMGVPLGWRKPRRIFVCSLADLFHDAVPDAFIAKVWATMSLTPQHTFQVLTKRPARMRSLLDSARFWSMVSLTSAARGGNELHHDVRMLDNVWLGVSAETQEWANRRIPILLDTPASVRWVSAEPLLGPIDLANCAGIDALERDWLGSPGGEGTGAPHPLLSWVVCGGESGPGARPMYPDWARSLRDQCVDAKIPFLYKQWGEWTPTGERGIGRIDGREFLAGEPDDRGFREVIRRVGKKAAGRVLDGRTWTEYPVMAP
jgi:protein gp37